MYSALVEVFQACFHLCSPELAHALVHELIGRYWPFLGLSATWTSYDAACADSQEAAAPQGVLHPLATAG